MMREALFPEIYLRGTDRVSTEKAQTAIRASLTTKVMAVLMIATYVALMTVLEVDVSPVEPLFAVGLLAIVQILALRRYLKK